MNTFLRRLKYYGIGFGIGLVFVVLLFKQKGCSWTPGNRVKESLLSRVMVADSIDLAFLKQQHISTEGLRKLLENSSVSFSESDIKPARKTYVLFGELPNGKSLTYLITLHDQDFVVEVDFLHRSPSTFQRTRGLVKPVLFKPQKNWFHGDWNQYAIEGLNGGDTPEKVTRLFFENGQIALESTSLNEAKPTHQLLIPYHNKTLCLTAFYFQEKIEVRSMAYGKP